MRAPWHLRAWLVAALLVAAAAPGAARELSVRPRGAVLSGGSLHLVVESDGLRRATVSLDGTVLEEVSLTDGETEVTLQDAAVPAGRHVVVVSGEGIEAETEIRTVPGWLSIVPPVLAIALALVFKDVLVSLFLGVFVGALVLVGWNPWDAFTTTIGGFIRGSLADPDNASILLFSLLLGGMVGIISKSGGTHGIVERLSGFATDVRRGQLSGWLMGLMVFFDDYANTLIVGPTMRPITDRLRISREKLAYIVDSTAAPIASLVPISTWVGYEVGLIGAALTQLGLDFNAYGIFVETIPYRFYPIFALVMVGIVAVTGRDFGPMLRAERRARSTGEVLAAGDVALADYTSEALVPPEGLVHRARNAVLPILTVIVMTVLGLILTGAEAIDPELRGMERVREVFANADSYAALMWASLGGVILAGLLAVIQPQISVQDTMQALVEGFKSMLLALVVLVLAWSLGSVTGELHTADFIVGLAEGILSPHFVPALIFLVSAAIAFATGTSWATMAILVPLVIPVIHHLAIGIGLDPTMGSYRTLLLGTISSVLAGSVWGDHCSPISDTTILSSMASGCDHIAHVRTQMPYALSLGILGILVGDIPTAWGMSPWISLAVGVTVIAVGVRWLGHTTD